MKLQSIETNQRSLTFLGYLGAAPFLVAAAVAWTAPAIVPAPLAQTAGIVSLAYGAIIVAYMAGMGGGAMLAANQPAGGRLLAGMIATLAGWAALWPHADMADGAPAAIRFVVIIAALVFLCLRDLAAVRDGELPPWYAPLRVRLTVLATAGLSAVCVRVAMGAA